MNPLFGPQAHKICEIRDLSSVWALLPWQDVAVPKVVKYDQVFFKTWSRAIDPQHSPVTHPESLSSDQCRFEHLELGSSCFDLL